LGNYPIRADIGRAAENLARVERARERSRGVCDELNGRRGLHGARQQMTWLSRTVKRLSVRVNVFKNEFGILESVPVRLASARRALEPS